MKSHEVTWEDDDCNRQIEFSIAYEVENSEVKISKVTPTRVNFTCPESKSVTRTIRVHTATGQKMLAERFAQSGRLEQVSKEIEESLSV